MITDTINFLNEYDCATHEIDFVNVTSTTLTELFKNIKKLRSLVYEENSEELEERFKVLNQLFSQIKTSLLPYEQLFANYFSSDIRNSIVSFFKLLMEYNATIEVSNLSKRTMEILVSLKKGDVVNSLASEIENRILQDDLFETIAIVSYFPEVISTEYANKKIVYITPNKLIQGTKTYSKVFYIGTSDFYPSSKTIFFGKKTYYIGYDFYRNGFEKLTLVNGNSEMQSGIYRNVKIGELVSYRHDISGESIEKLEDFSVPTQSLESWVTGYKKTLTSEGELRDGVLFSLRSGSKVIFPTTGKVDVLEIENMDMTDVEVTKLDSESIIVLRVSTEISYLSKKAYDEYGNDYLDKVNIVKEYKVKLLNLKSNLGTFQKLRSYLENRGISISSSTVLRTWTTMDVLAPGETEKFARLLSIIGLNETRVAETITATQFVKAVHRKIGRELSKKMQYVIAKLNQNDLYTSLQKDKYYIFDEPGIGEFRIEIVEEKYTELVQVTSADYYRIFNNYE